MNVIEIPEGAYSIVQTIMIVFAIVYLFLEIILNLNDIDNDTSNVILLQASKGKLFFIPFVLGAIMGHLFLGTENNSFEMNSTYPIIIVFAFAIIAVIVAFKIQFKKSILFLSSLLVLGLLFGHLFWSMNYK